MTIDNKIKDKKTTILTKKQQKNFALSSGKIDKYEYVTGEQIIRVELQSKLIPFLGKVYNKQIKNIESQGEKQKNHLKSMENNQLILMHLLEI